MPNKVMVEVLPGRRLRVTGANGQKIELRLDRLAAKSLAATLADEAGAAVVGVAEPRVGEVVFGDSVEVLTPATKTVRLGDSKRVVRLPR